MVVLRPKNVPDQADQTDQADRAHQADAVDQVGECFAPLPAAASSGRLKFHELSAPEDGN